MANTSYSWPNTTYFLGTIIYVKYWGLGAQILCKGVKCQGIQSLKTAVSGNAAVQYFVIVHLTENQGTDL